MDVTTPKSRENELFEALEGRMRHLGFLELTFDHATVRHIIATCEREILSEINHTELPKELTNILVDKAAGHLLYEAKTTGRLSSDSLHFSEPPPDFSAPIKSITEGDVSITFAGASDGVKTVEARFDALVERLMHPPESVLGAYRRLRW